MEASIGPVQTEIQVQRLRDQQGPTAPAIGRIVVSVEDIYRMVVICHQDRNGAIRLEVVINAVRAERSKRQYQKQQPRNQKKHCFDTSARISLGDHWRVSFSAG